jgi:hypothetical protein
MRVLFPDNNEAFFCRRDAFAVASSCWLCLATFHSFVLFWADTLKTGLFRLPNFDYPVV